MAYATAASSRPHKAARLRPGERPVWWDVSADRPQFNRWRHAAAEHQVGLDALLAALIELDLAMRDLVALNSPPDLMLCSALASERSSVAWLTRSGPWRQWLIPGTAAYEHDELPELVLPERLTGRLTPGGPLGDRIRLELSGLALDCDRLAARQGRTLESWALSTALTRVSSGSPAPIRGVPWVEGSGCSDRQPQLGGDACGLKETSLHGSL